MPLPRFTAEEIGEYSQLLYGVELTSKVRSEIYAELVKLSARTSGWSTAAGYSGRTSSGIAVWLKSRLQERGFFHVDRSNSCDIRCTTEMHCFFIYISETQEQIEVLRGELIDIDGNRPVRSRISQYMQNNTVSPIDRTAFNVAPPPN